MPHSPCCVRFRRSKSISQQAGRERLATLTIGVARIPDKSRATPRLIGERHAEEHAKKEHNSKDERSKERRRQVGKAAPRPGTRPPVGSDISCKRCAQGYAQALRQAGEIDAYRQNHPL